MLKRDEGNKKQFKEGKLAQVPLAEGPAVITIIISGISIVSGPREGNYT
jgi:hypothetical protein